MPFNRKGIFLTSILLLLFIFFVVVNIYFSKNNFEFMIAHLACIYPSCTGLFSNWAIWMIMFFIKVLMFSLILGGICHFSQEYYISILLIWLVSAISLFYIFIIL